MYEIGALRSVFIFALKSVIVGYLLSEMTAVQLFTFKPYGPGVIMKVKQTDSFVIFPSTDLFWQPPT